MKLSIMYLFVVLALSVSLVTSAKTYKNYQLLKIAFETDKQKALLEMFRTQSNHDEFRFLLPGIPANKTTVYVLVSPTASESCFKFLLEGGFQLQIINTDFSKRIKQEARINNLNRKRKEGLSYYMRYAEINTYITNAASNCQPPLTCNVLNLGKSYEGRDIYVLEVTSGDANKPYLHIDSGIHPREWIAPAANLYFLDKLIGGTNSDLLKLLETFNFYIIPLLNPDGYEYSFTNDRLWRKNRKPTSKQGCSGVDLNRNFGYNWGTSDTSTDPCDETYGGEREFSEPESQLLGSFIRSNKDKIKLYLTLHSYGQDILYTYGDRNQHYPPNYLQMKEAGEKAANAISQITGNVYQVGNDADVLYPASGASDDYSSHFGIPFAYTIELQDQGDTGFLLPPSEIPTNGQELTQMVIEIGNYIATQNS